MVEEFNWMMPGPDGLGPLCLTDRIGDMMIAGIAKFDSARSRADIFIYDPVEEEMGWPFARVPAMCLARVNPEAQEPSQSPAHQLVLQALNFDEPRAALEAAIEALEAQPDHWFAAELCGDCYAQLGNWASAASFYRRALESPRARRYPAVFSSYAWALGKLRQREEEAEIYRACLALDPDWPNARNNLGWALMKLGLLDEAVPVLEEALRRGNDGKYPLRNLATVLRRLGRLKEAEALFSSDVRAGKITKWAERELAKLREQPASGSPVATTGDDEDAQEPDVGPAPSSIPPRNSGTAGAAFNKEKHLEQEIVESIDRGQTIFGQRLRLYVAPDGRSGRQFWIPRVGIIDLLAVDDVTGDLVVIELKRGKGDDEVVGQTSAYVGWVKEALAKSGQRVRGVIVVRESSERLRLAAASADLLVKTYGLTIS